MEELGRCASARKSEAWTSSDDVARERQRRPADEGPFMPLVGDARNLGADSAQEGGARAIPEARRGAIAGRQDRARAVRAQSSAAAIRARNEAAGGGRGDVNEDVKCATICFARSAPEAPGGGRNLRDWLENASV